MSVSGTDRPAAQVCAEGVPCGWQGFLPGLLFSVGRWRREVGAGSEDLGGSDGWGRQGSGTGSFYFTVPVIQFHPTLPCFQRVAS